MLIEELMRHIRLDEAKRRKNWQGKNISAFVAPMKKIGGKNHFLLGTRASGGKTGTIGALGGKVDYGEKRRWAAEREAHEEGKLDVRISKKHKYFSTKNKRLRTYITTKYKGKPKKSSEMKKFKWYSKEELRKLNKKGKLHKSAQVIIESAVYCDDPIIF